MTMDEWTALDEAHHRGSFEDLVESVKDRIRRYELVYKKACEAPEQFREARKRGVRYAFTSYIEGVSQGVLFGFDVDYFREFNDLIDDMDIEFLDGQSIIGICVL